LMAIDMKLYKRLKLLFGDALVQIGDESYYMGSTVMPVAVEVQHSLASLIKTSGSLNPYKRQLRRELLSFFLYGLPKRYLQEKYLNQLEMLETLSQAPEQHVEPA
jgi:hypothetical protein